ncbi:hypothetical protein K525DRAFT_152687, partial [Schizophyllum commune Loenen D]
SALVAPAPTLFMITIIHPPLAPRVFEIPCPHGSAPSLRMALVIATESDSALRDAVASLQPLTQFIVMNLTNHTPGTPTSPPYRPPTPTLAALFDISNRHVGSALQPLELSHTRLDLAQARALVFPIQIVHVDMEQPSAVSSTPDLMALPPISPSPPSDCGASPVDDCSLPNPASLRELRLRDILRRRSSAMEPLSALEATADASAPPTNSDRSDVGWASTYSAGLPSPLSLPGEPDRPAQLSETTPMIPATASPSPPGASDARAYTRETTPTITAARSPSPPGESNSHAHLSATAPTITAAASPPSALAMAGSRAAQDAAPHAALAATSSTGNSGVALSDEVQVYLGGRFTADRDRHKRWTKAGYGSLYIALLDLRSVDKVCNAVGISTQRHSKRSTSVFVPSGEVTVTEGHIAKFFGIQPGTLRNYRTKATLMKNTLQQLSNAQALPSSSPAYAYATTQGTLVDCLRAALNDGDVLLPPTHSHYHAPENSVAARTVADWSLAVVEKECSRVLEHLGRLAARTAVDD